ncbi:MAG: diguanylate cyclase [Desulfobacterales bacterium]|nr:MAG: diguanylate cyclase [Desulfobacterales bacterium]
MDELRQLIAENEDWLIERILSYAKNHGYTKYTSTLEEAWRLSIAGLASSLQEGIRQYSSAPELGSDDSYTNDFLTKFGVIEARRHRERGVSIGMFMGLMKYYRQSYIDLVELKCAAKRKVKAYRYFLERCFDRIEIAFCREWADKEQSELLSELQHKNRLVTNEKHKYLTLLESLPNPVILADEKNQFEYMNHEAALLFEDNRVCGVRHYHFPEDAAGDRMDNSAVGSVGLCLPWLDDELAAFAGGSDLTHRFEKAVSSERGDRIYVIRFSRMQDISGKFLGTVIILEDTTGSKDMEKRLRQQNEALEQGNQELERANRQILEQQKSMIEEERLKVLLQMAGATAHELNQPLMALLGYIELMAMDRGNPENMAKYSEQIEDAGRRIAEIVKKIQTIRHDQVKHYAGETTILNLDRSIQILSVEDNDLDFRKIKAVIEKPELIRIERAYDSEDAIEMLARQSFDLIFLDYALPSSTALDLMRLMDEKELEIPVVVITGKGDEMIASQVIQAGAYDYLPKSQISKKSLTRIINNTLEKFRMKIEIKQAMDKMAELSTKDELTDLYNRRYFMEFAEREISGAARYGQHLTICMLDLDNFKKINDAYGHPAGDSVLKETARLLRGSIRQYDLPCRYGGEEFAVIMPNTQLADAEKFCERLRKKIEDTTVRYDSKEIRFTVSIGLAQFTPALDKSTADLIKRADDGLYAAKKQGRNRLVAATEKSEQPTAGGMHV